MTTHQRDQAVSMNFVLNGLILFYGTPMMMIYYEPPLWLKIVTIAIWVLWLDQVVFQRLWDPHAPDLSREPEE